MPQGECEPPMAITTRSEPLTELAPTDDMDDDPALSWADDGELLVDPDEVVPSADVEDWPGTYGAARLGIP